MTWQEAGQGYHAGEDGRKTGLEAGGSRSKGQILAGNGMAWAGVHGH